MLMKCCKNFSLLYFIVVGAQIISLVVSYATRRIARTESHGQDVHGYQNPHEIEGDVRVRTQQGRNQIIDGRWPKTGIIMFYSSFNRNATEKCLMVQAASIIAKYACIPIHAIEISQRCAKTSNTMRCVLDSKPGEEGLDPVAYMKEHAIPMDKNALRDYILLQYSKNKQKCDSEIGRQGLKQIINYGSRCFRNGVGSIMHEMIHALGYDHEHTRSDRDKYISINRTNIKSGDKYNFDKADISDYNDFGPYDFRSLMHYSAYAFAKNLNYTTITVKNSRDKVYHEIGQRVMLTVNDKAKIRSVTRCPGKRHNEHVKAIEKIDNGMTDTNLTTMSSVCY